MKFEKLKTGNVSEIEKSIREDWGGVENILKKTIENRNGKDKYVFYDGPIYANAKPQKMLLTYFLYLFYLYYY